MTLKVGDVVRLKSGGPAMTVDHVETDRHGVNCAHTVWFERERLNRFACLPVAAFVKVTNGQA